jgi:homoserine O-succinyltransferase
MFGIFPHRSEVENCQLLRGFDDIFYVPHSRNTEVRREDIEKVDQLEILTYSELSGVPIVANKNGRQYFITGHSEYDRDTIASEYFRDLDRKLKIDMPQHYFPGDDVTKTPNFDWACSANRAYANWLNYCVYQQTPYNLDELEIRSWTWENNFL